MTFKYEELEDLGISLEKDKLIDILPMMGSDIEDFDDETVKVEFFPNRPDLLSVEGMSRNLKGFLSQEIGLPEYELVSSGEKVYVDSELEDIRPFVSFALVKGVRIDDDKLMEIMDFQENLHWVIGRDRKKVAIGIHNSDVVNGPYRYIASAKDENSFVPLDCTDEMTPQEILTQHDKGVGYAHLIEEYDKYPLILDKDNQILSMPPIINGELTKLTNKTTNILIDVTGTDLKAVTQTLNIICTSFAEVGGQIQSLEIITDNNTRTTPDLTPKTKKITVKNTNKYIGIKLSAEDIQKLLLKARMNAKILNPNEIEATIPAYRIDILHEVDLIENVAVQYCINKINSKLPEISTIANEHKWFKSDKIIREALIGLEFQEIMSLMLTSEENHYTKMKQTETEHVQVAQPITIDRTMIRTSLLNGLLEFFEDNKHEDLPQKIFEIGDVLYIDPQQETKTRTVKKLAAATTHSTANFTEIKSTVYTVLENLGYNITIEKTNNPTFIKGRCANITGTSKQGTIKGVFGELSPEIITNFELEYPVIAFEIEF